MKNIVLILGALILITMGCKKEDISGPTIKFTSPDDSSVIVPSQDIDVSYTLSDDAGIVEHRLDVIDADTTVLFTFDKDKAAGTYTEKINLEACAYKSPVVIRVTAKDGTGNIGSQALTLDGQSVEVNLTLSYKSEPMIYLKDYTYPSGERMQFTRATMYVSELGLDDKRGACVDFLDFSGVNGKSIALAKQGLKLQADGIPDGTYQSVQLSVGLSDAMNDMDPSNFSSTHPLNAPAEYWNGWKSYVFLKLEGNIDLDDNAEDLETAFALHLGGNDDPTGNPINAKMSVKLDSTITIDSENRSLKLDMDLYKVFENDGAIYDMKAKPQTHAPATIPYILTLARNTEKAFTIR